MKHIAIDARESGTSTGRYIDKLIEHMHALKPEYEITVLTKQHRQDYMAQIAPSFKTVLCPHEEFTFAEQVGFKEQLERMKPDLVHFGMVQQPVFYHGKTVTTMHDLTTIRFRNPSKNAVIFTIKQQVYKWVNKRVAKKSNAIITPTEFVKKDIVDYTHINPEKITVTLESADDLPVPGVPVAGLENAEFIMYIGRPTPHKNLERLMDAFALLKQKHPELKLVLAGKKDALYEAHERRANEHGIKDIVFTGFISDEQLRWLYEHTKAYCFPSLSEGFGLPGVEALRHGAPVVASNATCLPEVLGDAAHYFDPTNVEDMARAIEDIITDPILRGDLVEKGRVQAAKYSWRRMAEQTLEVYNKILR